ncbi:hypothetical protein ACHAPT_005545 [Fusarium lateritium]
MYFGCLWPWGGKSPRSSKLHKTDKRKAERDKKTTNGGSYQTKEDETNRDNGSGTDDEDITTDERQTDSPWDESVRHIGGLLARWVPYMLLRAFLFVVFTVCVKSLDKSSLGGNSLTTAMGIYGLSKPETAWPAVILTIINAIPATVNWFSTDWVNKTTSTFPQVRFQSPISDEEAFVIPRYLPTLKSYIAQWNAMEENSKLSLNMAHTFQRAMEEAKLLERINDGVMTDTKSRFTRHYGQLGHLHVDIERAIIDIADRDDTTTSWLGGVLTTDYPYARAKSHRTRMLSIIDDMINARKSEIKDMGAELMALAELETNNESHGAICKLRSKTLEGIPSSSKMTKDIHAKANVMCNSSMRSKVALNMALDAFRKNLGSLETVQESLSELQHDRAKTFEKALLSHSDLLMKAMRELAKFGNG